MTIWNNWLAKDEEFILIIISVKRDKDNIFFSFGLFGLGVVIGF